VRLIFRRYLEVSGINELARDLKERNILTKARTFSTGKTRGGIPFGRGTLSHLLRNRFFIGEVEYKGEILPGEQPPIMDRTLFDEVQKKLSTHQSHETLARHKSEHLLKDILFDDAGHRMNTGGTCHGHHYDGDADGAIQHHELQDLNGAPACLIDSCELAFTHAAMTAYVADALTASNPVLLERPPKSFLFV